MGLVTILLVGRFIFLLMVGGFGRFEHGIYFFSDPRARLDRRLPRKNRTTVLGRGPAHRHQAKDHAAQHWPRGWFWRWIRKIRKSVSMALTSMGGANLAAGEQMTEPRKQFLPLIRIEENEKQQEWRTVA